jgi:pimeloyl-ACP methyl ester carboxylesterase
MSAGPSTIEVASANGIPPAGGRELPLVEGVRHRFVQAGRVRLHVAEAGAGPPLVLLHGWPQHWYLWRDLIPPLAERYRVICPDMRGFGWSEAPPDGYDKETLARDVIALLDELGIERCFLAGHDWGGWTGFVVSMLAPERVERYMALNIALPFAPVSMGSMLDGWRLWYQWVLGAPVLGARLVRSRLSRDPGAIGYWGGTTRAWDDEATEIFISQVREPERARATELLYRSFWLRDFPWMMTGRYRRMGLRIPALVVHGLEDHVVRPSNLKGFERYAPDMSVELVPGCGHFIVDEQPELVLDRALSFFSAS